MTVITMGAHILDMLIRPVDAIPTGQGTTLVEDIRVTPPAPLPERHSPWPNSARTSERPNGRRDRCRRLRRTDTNECPNVGPLNRDGGVGKAKEPIVSKTLALLDLNDDHGVTVTNQ
jgi:hypothetical protein